ILILFFCLPLIILAQNDDEIIKVDSSIVLMNAVITDSEGKPVGGLKKNQFKIFEDGAEQEISIFETQETPFAAVILLDTSGSMEQRISLARSAAINFLDGLRRDDSAAIYNFDTKVSLIQDFSNSRDVAEKVFDLKAYGYTALNDAVYKAAAELANRPEKRRAIIVLSDGADNKSARSAEKALKAANLAGATVYTVDMSAIDTGGRDRMQNQGVLKNFAEKTGGIFVPTPGGNALRQAFKNIVAELGVQYTLGYQSSNSKKDGKWRAIEIKVARPNLSIRTRKGYNAEKEKK
ncbi:MAG TPA: VWA domain-containing protein, partial [Pyrinomonadaceae bacterium]